MASPETGEEIEGEGEAASLLPKAQRGRPRGDEIRDKYRLREGNDRYGKMKASRNAGAVSGSSSTLPDVRSPSHGGSSRGLQVVVCVHVCVSTYWYIQGIIVPGFSLYTYIHTHALRMLSIL